MASFLSMGAVFTILATSAGVALAGPLQDAASQGNLELITHCLDEGSDISELDEAGDPALVLASLKGQTPAVALLLSRGADIDVRNKGGLTALHAAAYAGSLDIVRLLISEGADVNENKNFYSMSPLHAAAEEGHSEVVGLLLENNADVGATERNGYTPLTQAGWRGYWDVGERLMKAGATCQPAELVGEPLFLECTRRQKVSP